MSLDGEKFSTRLRIPHLHFSSLAPSNGPLRGAFEEVQIRLFIETDTGDTFSIGTEYSAGDPGKPFERKKGLPGSRSPHSHPYLGTARRYPCPADPSAIDGL